jgi:hypothetical protein
LSLVSNSNRKITFINIIIQSAKIIKNKKCFYEINHLNIIKIEYIIVLKNNKIKIGIEMRGILPLKIIGK